MYIEMQALCSQLSQHCELLQGRLVFSFLPDHFQIFQAACTMFSRTCSQWSELCYKLQEKFSRVTPRPGVFLVISFRSSLVTEARILAISGSTCAVPVVPSTKQTNIKDQTRQGYANLLQRCDAEPKNVLVTLVIWFSVSQ